ncbi:MAG TPA: hypothetical protein VN253_00245 [Kofleriaceae bacterium]|nr:hypothetical protein [Kofleriaceae bacterium]
MAEVVLGARLVALARARAFGLAPGSGALAAVRPEDHLDLRLLRTTFHHLRLRMGWCRTPSRHHLDFAELVYRAKQCCYCALVSQDNAGLRKQPGA